MGLHGSHTSQRWRVGAGHDDRGGRAAYRACVWRAPRASGFSSCASSSRQCAAAQARNRKAACGVMSSLRNIILRLQNQGLEVPSCTARRMRRGSGAAYWGMVSGRARARGGGCLCNCWACDETTSKGRILQAKKPTAAVWMTRGRLRNCSYHAKRSGLRSAAHAHNSALSSISWVWKLSQRAYGRSAMQVKASNAHLWSDLRWPRLRCLSVCLSGAPKSGPPGTENQILGVSNGVAQAGL